MKIASEEIRTLVVRAYNSGVSSRKQLSEIFGYHIDSIGRWIRESRKTERLAPLPRGHRRSVFSCEEREQLAEFIEKNPDATLEEIRGHFQKHCSLVAIHKIVSKLGYIFKKNSEGERARARGYPQESARMARISGANERTSPGVS